MYKHFQGGNAKTICDHINKNGMKIHSIEQRNTVIQCIAEPGDDDRELKAVQGSVMQVAKSLNEFGRIIEGKVLIEGQRATAFYRYDEKVESKMRAEMNKKAKAEKEKADKAERDAKKAKMKKELDELKAKMEKVDSDPSDAEKEEAKKQAEEASREDARKNAMRKEKERKEKAKKQAEAKKKKEEAKAEKEKQEDEESKEDK